MSSEDGAFTIAIVGGGAVGTALFGALVDRLASQPSPRTKARVVLFEKSGRIGPGLAYARDAAPYLLNQSARTMSVVPGRRSHFCEWLGARALDPVEPRQDPICARERFGDYVEDCFARAFDRARHHGLAVSTIRDEVVALAPRRLGGHRVVTSCRAFVDADVVVLALGNLPSTRFRALGGPGFVPSPYPSAEMCGRIPPDARVGILGTGLSAIDAALALFAAGHTSTVTMVSRGGLLPAVRGPLHAHELQHVTHDNIARATDFGRRPLRLGTLVRWVELELEREGSAVCWDRDFPRWADPLERCASEVAAAERGPRASQSIGEALNPMIEVVWRHLADDDKRRFLERFYGRFMAHWVPIPLVTGRRLLALLRERKLTVERGLSLAAFDERSRAYRLHLPERVAEFDFVVDATGAPRHVSECDSTLLQALLRQGTIVAHECGGLRVDFESLRVLGRDGKPDPGLFAIGNLTFGTHLFTSTLELNVAKAARVAGAIVSRLHPRSQREPHVDATPHPT